MKENHAQKAKCFNKRKKKERKILFSSAWQVSWEVLLLKIKEAQRRIAWFGKIISRKLLAPSTSHFPPSNSAKYCVSLLQSSDLKTAECKVGFDGPTCSHKYLYAAIPSQGQKRPGKQQSGLGASTASPQT